MADILLIDDDASSRALLRSLLSIQGHKVRCCGSGDEAMRAMANWHYQLVVTDILMPRMDGLETIRAVLADHPDVPVIAVSGGGAHGFDFLHAARSFGAVAAVRKPVVRGELEEAVETALGKAACRSA